MDIWSGLIIVVVVAVIVNFFLFLIVANRSKKEKKYERRFRIYKSLFENSIGVNLASLDISGWADFVSAFNMLLVEFKGDKEIMGFRNNFLEAVGEKPLDWSGQRKALISLVVAVGKKIGISIDPMDIQAKMYWPELFNMEIGQRQKLVDLEIKLLEKISNGEISMK